ncbi:hypothetical protein B5G04_08680 [Bacteroides sp. An51A]|nr:hypothetical protein B5G04_08680 [Bacteroides sp. An51A]
MRKIAGYLTKNRSEKDQKIAQSTHENEYIKPRKTFWRNSKQLLKTVSKFYRCKSVLHQCAVCYSLSVCVPYFRKIGQFHVSLRHNSPNIYPDK